jgi:secretion/DNA translocation related TadE-like protein
MRPRRLCREDSQRDRGSGTVWMIALIAVVWVVAMVAMSAGGVRAARHRAQATADLAALAAASHAREGSVRACGVAATVTLAAHARLINCALRARIAAVKVVVATQVMGLGSVHINAIARAGPVRRPESRAQRHRDRPRSWDQARPAYGGRSARDTPTSDRQRPNTLPIRLPADPRRPAPSPAQADDPRPPHGRHLRVGRGLVLSRSTVSRRMGTTRHPKDGRVRAQGQMSAGRAVRAAARSERDRIVHMGAESSFRMLGLSPMQDRCYRRVLYATVSIRVQQGSSASPVRWHQCPSGRTTKGTTP